MQYGKATMHQPQEVPIRPIMCNFNRMEIRNKASFLREYVRWVTPRPSSTCRFSRLTGYCFEVLKQANTTITKQDGYQVSVDFIKQPSVEALRHNSRGGCKNLFVACDHLWLAQYRFSLATLLKILPSSLSLFSALAKMSLGDLLSPRCDQLHAKPYAGMCSWHSSLRVPGVRWRLECSTQQQSLLAGL